MSIGVYVKLINYITVEVRLNRAIDEIRAVEDEKRENAVSEERRISAELRATIDELRAVRVPLAPIQLC